MATRRPVGPDRPSPEAASALRPEFRALDAVPESVRHGRASDTGWLWLAANLGLPPWSLGVLGLALGMSVTGALTAIVVANILAALLLGAVSMLGPETGTPAIVLTRRLFGERANRLPSVLNALSCMGWYAVNAVLGAEALSLLLHVALPASLGLITIFLLAAAIYGHDLVHRVERYLGYVLVVLFAVMAARLATAGGHPALFGVTASAGAGTWVLMVAIVASYLLSWGPYATDYSRYLPRTTGRQRVFSATAVGAFVSTTAVEVLGVWAAFRVGTSGTPVATVVRAMGPWAVPLLVAVVLGTVTANALNVYTGSLSSLSAGIRLSRPVAAVLFALVGGLVAYLGANGYYANYEDFLLLISYWVAPWIGIVLARSLPGARGVRAVASRVGRLRLFWVFLASLALSIPFMDQTLYEGPVAKWLGGGDIGYWVGLVLAFVLTRWVVGRDEEAPRKAATVGGAEGALNEL